MAMTDLSKFSRSAAESESGGKIGFDLAEDGQGALLRLSGDWTVWQIGAIEEAARRVAAVRNPGKLRVDAGAMTRMDTAGALAFDHILQQAGAKEFELVQGDKDLIGRLLEQVRQAPKAEPAKALAKWTWRAQLEKIGRGAVDARKEAIDTLAFLGEAATAMANAVVNPKLLRWPSIVHIMETAGINALPILLTLSFFIGMVIAYMGVNLLRSFGAEVFTVELVAVSVLREFGVFITAILIAGRTDSAFAAELGAMKLNEEVDALRAMGLDPMQVLVTPRIIALFVMTPLLTFGAMMAGLAGGLVVLWTSLDMNPSQALARIHEVVPLQHFWVGLSKAPVFGLILSVIGCRQGLAVERDVQSLGARTTAAVVQSIFLVVVVDALFAIAYLQMDI
jgi:phospholipid/cholesterol/gamma-HCH transport system permease protein